VTAHIALYCVLTHDRSVFVNIWHLRRLGLSSVVDHDVVSSEEKTCCDPHTSSARSSKRQKSSSNDGPVQPLAAFSCGDEHFTACHAVNRYMRQMKCNKCLLQLAEMATTTDATKQLSYESSRVLEQASRWHFR
jgi:hypothetical protein